MLSNVHPLKPPLPIEFIDVGRVIFWSNVHPLRAQPLVEIIDVGSVMWPRDVYPWKEHSPIKFINAERMIFTSDAHSLKALSPIKVTSDGNETHFDILWISFSVFISVLAVLHDGLHSVLQFGIFYLYYFYCVLLVYLLGRGQ